MNVLRQCAVVIAIVLLLGLVPADGAQLTERIQIHQEFSVAPPADWSVRQIANTQQIFAAPAEAIDRGEVVLEDIARVVIHTERRTDRAEALLRLKQIEAESDTPSSFVLIAGWPALQRVQEMAKPHAGKPGDPRPARPMQLVVTTAIAVDNLIVRFEAVLPSDATPKAIGEVLMIGESVNTRAVGDPDAAQQEVDRLNSEPVLHTLGISGRTKQDRVPLDRPPPEPEAVLIAGAPLRVTNQGGIDAELEITVSTDGRDIVIGSNSNYFVSNDGGQSFATSVGILGNDPSLGYGASGAFWAANIGGVCDTAILTSTNNGQNFAATTSAYTCPNAVPTPGLTGCVQDLQCAAGFPDQEHIAADRYNPAPGGDQIYSAWRSLWSNVGVGIVCSQDSGATWTNAIFTLGDFPRITVGQDGTVYVVYRQGNNIQLWRLSSCATGLVASMPVVVVTGNPQVPCPVPGLNRCNDGNNLSSPTVAVDDENANHIFVSYAVNTGPNNENVLLQDSLDGGANWGSCRSACGSPLPGDSLSPCTPGGPACPVGGEVCCPNAVQVSSGILGRRFMPWVCSVGGEAYVTWFDRRNATAADNSLTDFFAGNAERDGFALNAGDEIQYTPVSDSHCGPPSTNWPGSAPRNSNDSESCTQQPQFAGQCRTGTCMATCGTPTVGDSLNACNPGGPACPGAENCCVTTTGPRCDFSDSGTTACNMTTIGQVGGQCSAAEFCACAGGSPPKHGDYNGNACMAGRLYSTWVSATSPPAISPPSTSIDIFFSTKVVCCVPQVQVPAPVAFDLACGGGSQTETLEVCNTGKEDLIVDAITSSATNFVVTQPSSGWGVTISPDFCFPFEVTYTPSGSGDQSATLTIPTNDPVNPSVQVAVTATSGVAAIDTFIANSGNFGDVCDDEHQDLNLTIQNNGTCDLEIDSVGLSGGDAADFDLPDGSLAGTILEAGNSLLVPVRFAPSNFTAPILRTASVDVASSTSGGAPLALDSTPVQGTAPPPDIQLAMAQLGDFGDVCKTGFVDLSLELFNQGKCDLTISNIQLLPDDGSFELPDTIELPLILSPDADFAVPVRFAPPDCFDVAEDRDVRVTSDDPDRPIVDIPVTGASPCPNLLIDPLGPAAQVVFPPTVVDTNNNLGCFADRSLNLRNNGECPLTIDSISANVADFTVIDPSLYPIILPSGEETLAVTVRFTPQSDADPIAPSEVTGMLTVVSDDPDGPSMADLCGESVAKSGVRILVTDQSFPVPVPIDNVDDMRVQTKGINTPSPINLHFTDQPLSSTAICGSSVDYHLDLEILPATHTTGNNPRSSYLAKAKEGNLQASHTLSLHQCELRDFQLQLGVTNSRR